MGREAAAEASLMRLALTVFRICSKASSPLSFIASSSSSLSIPSSSSSRRVARVLFKVLEDGGCDDGCGNDDDEDRDCMGATGAAEGAAEGLVLE